jgi:predicted metal-dependent hydrolase
VSASPTLSVRFGTATIEYRVNRGDRSRARVAVDPFGAVEVKVPQDYGNDELAALVQRRAAWILKQRSFFDRYRPREPARRYESGESIRYLGRQYRLRLEPRADGVVKLRGRVVAVGIPARNAAKKSDPTMARDAVVTWLRTNAQRVLHERCKCCLAVAMRHGIREPRLELRIMRRRWGSCTASGRVLLNPKLVQTPVDCIDYVILHELCHLRHPHHGTRFYRLLDMVLPDWRRRKDRLDRIALPDW